MVAPGCGLPVVRLVTVPSMAAEAMEAKHNSRHPPTNRSLTVERQVAALIAACCSVLQGIMLVLPSSVFRTRRRILELSGTRLYNWGRCTAAASSLARPEPTQPDLPGSASAGRSPPALLPAP